MVSLLDIIGPVMVGPSSSHTAGACRLGLLARCLVGGTPDRARIELRELMESAAAGFEALPGADTLLDLAAELRRPGAPS